MGATSAPRPAPSPTKPSRQPREYLSHWPDGHVLRVPEDEGGEAVEYAAEQMARLIRQIVDRRERKGYRRAHLAKLTGLRPNTIGDIEDGRAWPDMRSLCVLAWALDADLEFEPRVPLRARERSARYQV